MWRVAVLGEKGEEQVELYEAKEGIRFRKNMLDKLVEHLRTRENYVALEAITGVLSPEGEDYSKYAVFLLALKLSEDLAKALGEVHTYLFGVGEDGGPILLASSGWNDDRNHFLNCMGVLLENPDAVEMVVVALPLSKEKQAS